MQLTELRSKAVEEGKEKQRVENKIGTLSNMSQMADRGWWMDAMMVWPRSARLLMCSITFSAAKLSSPTRAKPLLSGHRSSVILD